MRIQVGLRDIKASTTMAAMSGKPKPWNISRAGNRVAGSLGQLFSHTTHTHPGRKTHTQGKDLQDSGVLVSTQPVPLIQRAAPKSRRSLSRLANITRSVGFATTEPSMIFIRLDLPAPFYPVQDGLGPASRSAKRPHWPPHPDSPW